MTQASLNFLPRAPATLAERFAAFHRLNPHVYRALRDKALRMRRTGRTHFGIAAIYEAARYDAALETVGEVWKLNNNHRAYYARLLMQLEPELRGFFATRRTAAEEV